MTDKTLEQEIKEYLVHIINPNLHDKDSHINQVLALIKNIDKQARIDECESLANLKWSVDERIKELRKGEL